MSVCVCDISVCIELLLAKNYMDLYGVYKALDRYPCHRGFNMSILKVHLLVLTKKQDELNEIVDLARLQSQHFTMAIYVSQSIANTYTYTHTHTSDTSLAGTHSLQPTVTFYVWGSNPLPGNYKISGELTLQMKSPQCWIGDTSSWTMYGASPKSG